MDLKEYIRSIPDYPKKGILFRDITTLIKNEKAFRSCIDQIVERSKKFKLDKIAAVESRGFVFASAVSYILSKPFIMLRKKDKLPAETPAKNYILAKEDHYFVYPNQFNEYTRQFRGGFQHGGISMGEMILPVVTMTPRR